MSDLRTQRRADLLRELRELRARRARSAARRVALLRAASNARIPPQAQR